MIEVTLTILLFALLIPALFDLQSGSERAVVKAGEFMVASALLQNTSARYRTIPFGDIEPLTENHDETGTLISTGRPAFQVNVQVESVVMPNRWSKYKRVNIEVLKPGTFFGT
ncbi:MAG TPA: hypothetical protein PKO06_21680, partial [Candidatus Ozemobacteraceae bacterium]|nr:hypothetical protein [Candidatus Ozemobacteraceae bacterium]